jgi:hypothetical protein
MVVVTARWTRSDRAVAVVDGDQFPQTSATHVPADTSDSD